MHKREEKRKGKESKHVRERTHAWHAYIFSGELGGRDKIGGGNREQPRSEKKRQHENRDDKKRGERTRRGQMC